MAFSSGHFLVMGVQNLTDIGRNNPCYGEIAEFLGKKETVSTGSMEGALARGRR